MKKSGFTLAEVLITLTVIGVVAALTIPNLLQSSNQEELKTAYKKAFADLNQAFLQVKNDNYSIISSTADQWDTDLMKTFWNEFEGKISVIKSCGEGELNNCWNPTGEKYYGTYPYVQSQSLIDSSGRSWSMYCNTTSCSKIIFVDINGFKVPNKLGRDRFYFTIASSDGSWSGDLVKISPRGDIIGVDSNKCPSGDCYYTSWLYN